MFRTRVISGIILIIIALGTLLYGGNVLFGVLLVISLIGMSELYKLLDIHNKLLGIVGYLGAIGYYVILYMGRLDLFLMTTIGWIVCLMMVYVFTFPKYRSNQITLAFFGIFYVAVMLSYLYQIRIYENGIYLVWLVLICSWGCDTCAYGVGITLGKHRLAPKLSPKKSIEGALGGMIGAALLAALYAWGINKIAGMNENILYYAIIGGVGGIISQVGDLAASAMKRNFDIKDYGKLIPGHGGILDRFDSVIFTGPIVFYLVTVFMK